MRELRLLAVGVGAALALGIGVGFAADGGNVDYPPCMKKATQSDQDAAKAAHKAGTEWNDRGNYEKAISYWRDAYTLDCSAHGELINIANAYEKKGDKAGAIVALDTYLSRTGGTNQTIAERVARLKESVASAPPPPPSATPSAAPSAPPPPPTTTATGAPPPSTPPGERPYGAAPWVVVGIGGASLAAGAILVAVGYGGISSAEVKCPNHAQCGDPSAASEGNTGRLEVGVGWGALGVGVAGVGAGLIWQFAGNRATPSQPTQGRKIPSFVVLPAVGAHEKGVSVSGSF